VSKGFAAGRWKQLEADGHVNSIMVRNNHQFTKATTNSIMSKYDVHKSSAKGWCEVIGITIHVEVVVGWWGPLPADISSCNTISQATCCRVTPQLPHNQGSRHPT
jgi:hypothetical protein